MKKGIVLTSASFKVNIPLPIDDRAVLSSDERQALQKVRRYKWMIVTDINSGVRYQLQPPGGDINASLLLWIWRVIDSSAILSENLFVGQTALGIEGGTTYYAGTPLEDILRDLLTITRAPIAPSISIPDFPVIEKGSSGSVVVNPTYSLNDASMWVDQAIFYKDDFDNNSNTIIYNSILDNINVRVEREYKGVNVQDKPELSSDLPDGIAVSQNRRIIPRLPFFYGNGDTEDWNPNNVTPLFINNYLFNNRLGNAYRRVLNLPPSKIEIEFGFWNNSPTLDRYRWILIPVEWGKSIISYRANNIDFGMVGLGQDPFGNVMNLNINDPKSFGNVLWTNQPYILYSTNAKLTFSYLSNDLFSFTLT